MSPHPYPPVPSLQPEEPKEQILPLWMKKFRQCKSGFGASLWGRHFENKIVLFFASHAGKFRFLPLLNEPIGTNRYVLPFDWDFSKVFLSASGFLSSSHAEEMAGLPDDSVHAWKLTLKSVRCDLQAAHFEVLGKEEIVMKAKAARERNVVDEDNSNTGSSDGAGVFHCDSSDAERFHSHVETSAEECNEEAEANPFCSSGDEWQHRAAAGSYTTNNGYFSVTNHPHYKDIRVKILPRWARAASDGGMGLSSLQKQATIQHYDTDISDPKRTILVLQAWMIKRFQEHGFATSRCERQLWLGRMKSKLSLGIQVLAVIGGGTGSVQADRCIRARRSCLWREVSTASG